MTELVQQARAVVEEHEKTWEQLHELIRVHVVAAVRMRHYMPVFFGGEGLPPEAFDRWRSTSRAYEKIWRDTVELAMTEGVLERSDPVVATRLLLGMCVWVSRWYRPEENRSTEEIAEAAIRLLHIKGDPSTDRLEHHST
jgi:hypothetical protein